MRAQPEQRSHFLVQLRMGLGLNEHNQQGKQNE
jgi:hypothetical protein